MVRTRGSGVESRSLLLLVNDRVGHEDPELDIKGDALFPWTSDLTKAARVIL